MNIYSFKTCNQFLVAFDNNLNKFADAAKKELPSEIKLMFLQDATLQDKQLLAAYHQHLFLSSCKSGTSSTS